MVSCVFFKIRKSLIIMYIYHLSLRTDLKDIYIYTYIYIYIYIYIYVYISENKCLSKIGNATSQKNGIILSFLECF